MTQIVVPDLTAILSVFGLGTVVFSVYLYFRNPQIKTDQTTLKLEDKIKALEKDNSDLKTDIQKQFIEIKETHIRSIEGDIKTLTTAVNDLSKTVVRLSTIIDERIPKQNI